MFKELISVVNGISILSLIGLLFMYAKMLRKVRSTFTIGLTIFASLFLIEKLLWLYFCLTKMEGYESVMVPYLLPISVLQAIAFAVLLIITWE